jgi:hypothetical protein
MKLALAVAFLMGVLVGAIGAAGMLVAENRTLVDEVQALELLCESCLGPWD